MQRQQALRIVTSLANGVNPVTGEVFDARSPYQHPDVVRALFQAAHTLQEMVEPDPPQPPASTPRGVPEPKRQHEEEPPVENTFVRWTPAEEARLCAAFDAGKSSAELGKLHNRSRAAIEARLLKLGKIDVAALTVQLRYMPKASSQ